jgi:hypothetical protein
VLPQILYFNSGTVTTTNGDFLLYGSQTATEDLAQIVSTRNGTARNLYVYLGQSPGTGATRTITVRKTGAATTLTVAITGNNTMGSNTTDTFTFAPFDLLSVVNTVAGGALNSLVIASFEII